MHTRGPRGTVLGRSSLARSLGTLSALLQRAATFEMGWECCWVVSVMVSPRVTS